MKQVLHQISELGVDLEAVVQASRHSGVGALKGMCASALVGVIAAIVAVYLGKALDFGNSHPAYAVHAAVYNIPIFAKSCGVCFAITGFFFSISRHLKNPLGERVRSAAQCSSVAVFLYSVVLASGLASIGLSASTESSSFEPQLMFETVGLCVGVIIGILRPVMAIQFLIVAFAVLATSPDIPLSAAIYWFALYAVVYFAILAISAVRKAVSGVDAVKNNDVQDSQ